MNEAEYLSDRLENQIDWYGDKSNYCQKWHKRIKATEMTLAALVPVVLLFDFPCAKIITSCFGAAIVILSGISSLNKYQENWIEYRSIAETLKHEKFLYLTHSGVYAEHDTPFNLLVGRVESIISHENINWSQMNNCKDKA